MVGRSVGRSVGRIRLFDESRSNHEQSPIGLAARRDDDATQHIARRLGACLLVSPSPNVFQPGAILARVAARLSSRRRRRRRPYDTPDWLRRRHPPPLTAVPRMRAVSCETSAASLFVLPLRHARTPPRRRGLPSVHLPLPVTRQRTIDFCFTARCVHRAARLRLIRFSHQRIRNEVVALIVVLRICSSYPVPNLIRRFAFADGLKFTELDIGIYVLSGRCCFG